MARSWLIGRRVRAVTIHDCRGKYWSVLEWADEAVFVFVLLNTKFPVGGFGVLSNVVGRWKEGRASAFERRKEKSIFVGAPDGKSPFPGEVSYVKPAFWLNFTFVSNLSTAHATQL